MVSPAPDLSTSGAESPLTAAASTSSTTLCFKPSVISQRSATPPAIAGNAGSISIANRATLMIFDTIISGDVSFTNSSTGSFFYGGSAGRNSLGNTNIINNGGLTFQNEANGGNANIANNGLLVIEDHGTAGNAAVTNAPSAVADFSLTTGPHGDWKSSAGSIAGGGTFRLGRGELTVGSNNFTTTVTGTIT